MIRFLAILTLLLFTFSSEGSLQRGLDLSGSMQGAGGIGGLLARPDHSTVNPQPSTSFFHADGNGNISTLTDSSKKPKRKPYSWCKHNCAYVVNDALDAAKIPYPDRTPALPTDPPAVYWPADPNQTALRARCAPNSREYNFPKNTPIPADIGKVLKPFNKP
jgi:hypothetical protein